MDQTFGCNLPQIVLTFDSPGLTSSMKRKGRNAIASQSIGRDHSVMFILFHQIVYQLKLFSFYPFSLFSVRSFILNQFGRRIFFFILSRL
jgi:hypothetical protein